MEDTVVPVVRQDFTCFDEELVEEVSALIATPEEIDSMALLFKAASEPLRARMLAALTVAEELCVCDLCHVVGASQSAVSRQLRLLRSQDIVGHRKAAQLVFYRLHDDCIREMLLVALNHVRHSPAAAPLGSTAGPSPSDDGKEVPG